MTTQAPPDSPPAVFPPRPAVSRRRRKPNLFRTLSRVLIILIVIVQVYPLAWLFLTSMRTDHDFAMGDPFALPSSLTWEN
jgi:raffinose/stachyose/melibiose transport system permease protein